jgi:hypothetical protein
MAMLALVLGISFSIIATARVAPVTLNVTSVSAQQLTYGAVTFSGSWQYVGNVTLTGALSGCEALRLPCPSGGTPSQAEEFTNGTAIIYAESETTTVSNSETVFTILISDNAVYCISPASNGIAPVCPSLLDEP